MSGMLCKIINECAIRVNFIYEPNEIPLDFLWPNIILVV